MTNEYEVAKLRFTLENLINALALSGTLDNSRISGQDVRIIVDVVIMTLDQKRIFPAQGTLL